MGQALLTRRRVLQTAVAATTLAAPFVRGAYAAGKLSFGTWDHWVPGASEVLGKLCREWAEREKVDLTFDLITSNGDKDLLTLMAEGQAKAGHDILGLRVWYVSSQADNFVPLDDVVDPVIQKYGNVSQGCEYLGKIKGHWMAVPTCYGSAAGPPCARIDLLKEYVGLDIQKMYPVGPPDKALTDQWTWDYLLTASEKCMKAGKPVRYRAEHLHRRDQHGGFGVRQLRRKSRGRGRHHNGQDRCHQASARMVPEIGQDFARQRLRL